MERRAHPRSDTFASGASRPAGRSPRRPGLRRVLGWLGAGMLAATGGGCLVLLFGPVQGEEFSPQLFQRRHFRFYQVPLLRWQLTPVRRWDRTERLESAIAKVISGPVPTAPSAVGSRRGGALPPSTRGGNAPADPESARSVPPVCWHLIYSVQPGAPIWHGDAKILRDCLELREGERFFWSLWNGRHPDLAVLLWPRVAALAAARLYVALPELLRVAASAPQSAVANSARSDSDPADMAAFRAALDGCLVRQSVELGARAWEAGQPELAANAFRLALRYDPACSAAALGLERARAGLPSPAP